MCNFPKIRILNIFFKIFLVCAGEKLNLFSRKFQHILNSLTPQNRGRDVKSHPFRSKSNFYLPHTGLNKYSPYSKHTLSCKFPEIIHQIWCCSVCFGSFLRPILVLKWLEKNFFLGRGTNWPAQEGRGNCLGGHKWVLPR